MVGTLDSLVRLPPAPCSVAYRLVNAAVPLFPSWLVHVQAMLLPETCAEIWVTASSANVRVTALPFTDPVTRVVPLARCYQVAVCVPATLVPFCVRTMVPVPVSF